MSITTIKYNNHNILLYSNGNNVLLSGTSNPSSGDNIFGKSALPASGSPSKTRPNAVSELRNSCGGNTDLYGTPPGGASYFRYNGTAQADIGTGFKVDGNGGLFYTLDPGNPWTSCGSFDVQRPDIRQSNGVTGVETAGTKTVKIGFTTSNLQVPLCTLIEVKRLSDNVTLATTGYFSPAPGSNLFNVVSTLSWTNSVDNTKIGIIVTVSCFSDNCV
jgi:hypothetical protein